MKYQAVIFDLDGVICSTDRYHYLAWKKIADDLHIYFDEKINNRLRGVSRMESLEIVLERYDGNLTEEEKRALAEKKNQFYVELLEQMTEKDLSAEVSKTLVELREKGLKLAIGSSSKNAKRILGRLGLGSYFDAVSDGTNIQKSKPEPEVFLKAAEFLQMEPDKCLVVEDAEAGIEAAARGGFFTNIMTATATTVAKSGMRVVTKLLSTSFRELMSPMIRARIFPVGRLSKNCRSRV